MAEPVCAPVGGAAASEVPLVTYAAPIPDEPLLAPSDGSAPVDYGARAGAPGGLGGSLPPVGGGVVGPGQPGPAPSPTPSPSGTATPAPTPTPVPTPTAVPTPDPTGTPGPQPTPVTPDPSTPPVTPVPEPSMWLLMILGFGSLGVSLRRRRARALAGGSPPPLAAYRTRRGPARLAGLTALWSGGSALEAGDVAAAAAIKSAASGAAGKLMLCVCPAALAVGTVAVVPPVRNAVHAATADPASGTGAEGAGGGAGLACPDGTTAVLPARADEVQQGPIAATDQAGTRIIAGAL